MAGADYGMRSRSKFEFAEIDIGFVVNLATLLDILRSLSVGGKRWWIACDPVDALETHTLTIGHGDPACVDRLNTLYFNVPALNDDEPIGGADSLALLLDSSTISAVEPGLYMEDGGVITDPFEDMECFFRPIRQALIDRLKRE